MREKTATDVTPRHRVALVAHDGVSPFEFGAACEVFGFDRSHLGVPWYELAVCTLRPGPVSTMLGWAIHVEHSLDELERAQTVIVPPCGAKSDSVDARLLDALREAHRRGARIASLCTGAFVLAQSGLLDGRRATTHWSDAAQLAETFPRVCVDPRVLYIDEGDILTSAGSAASIDLCLHIVRRDFGAEIANAVARSLVVPPHRDGGQAQFVDTPVPPVADADLLAETLAWAQGNLGEKLTIEMLAQQAAMSPRTFARRFRSVVGTTPYRWLLQQRIMLAQRLLETTEYRIDHIAGLCGLGSAANLRLHFDDVVGVSPGSYRRTFRRHSVAA